MPSRTGNTAQELATRYDVTYNRNISAKLSIRHQELTQHETLVILSRIIHAPNIFLNMLQHMNEFNWQGKLWKLHFTWETWHWAWIEVKAFGPLSYGAATNSQANNQINKQQIKHAQTCRNMDITTARTKVRKITMKKIMNNKLNTWHWIRMDDRLTKFIKNPRLESYAGSDDRIDYKTPWKAVKDSGQQYVWVSRFKTHKNKCESSPWWVKCNEIHENRKSHGEVEKSKC